MITFFRGTFTVENHKINITLPNDFTLEEVEVIILPKDNVDSRNSKVNEPGTQYSNTKNSVSNFNKKTEAFRQIILLKNHKINITLPTDFNAEEVETIIFPTKKKEYTIPNWQIEQVRERTENYLKNPSAAQDFNQAMKEIEAEVKKFADRL